jgi:hypothetical protein
MTMTLHAPGSVLLASALLALSFACNPKASETEAETETSGSSSTTGDPTTSSSGSTDSTSGTSSGSTTSMTSSTSAGETDTGCSFLDCDTGGMTGACDPKSQDCPRGEKCTAVSPMEGEPWGINKCVPVAGEGQVGDPCDVKDGKYTGLDDCALGFICLLTDDEGMGGTCVEFCDTNDLCPQSGANCVTYNDGSLPICLANCDPLVQDCAAGQGCYPSGGDSFVCFKTSVGPGEGGQGSGCSYTNQCQPGLMCVGAASSAGCSDANGCCSPFCAISEGDGPCQESESCVPYFADGMAPPGYGDLGVCAIPE